MTHLHVRCPSCAKLYQIDVSAIFSTSPHFQCVACPTKFTFEFPPADPERIQTRAVEAAAPLAGASDGQSRSGGSFPVATRKCPKCGAESPKTADECYSCHVIFEKLEGLEPGLKTQPSLVRRWKELLEDYTDEHRHQAFLMACRDLDALDFARAKYEHIRQIQGQDDVADQMLLRITALKEVATVAKMSSPQKSENVEKIQPRWQRAAMAVPFVVAFLLILWGFTHAGQRNMVGAGIAVGLLSYGVITGLGLRLVLKDLFR